MTSSQLIADDTTIYQRLVSPAPSLSPTPTPKNYVGTEFVKLIIRLIWGGGLAPFGQTKGSFLRPSWALAGKGGLENDLRIAPMDLPNFQIDETLFLLPKIDKSSIVQSKLNSLAY